MSLMPEVFGRGQLHVDALRLEDYADLAAQTVGVSAASNPMITARPPTGIISVERIRNRVVLPLPFGPSSPNSSASSHVEGHAVQGGAAVIAVHQILDGNHNGNGKRALLWGSGAT